MQRVLLKSFIFVALAALIASVAQEKKCLASTEFSVASVYDGQTPYLIVLEDGEGTSKRKPGIYAADGAGKWQAIIPGHVITGGASHGVLAQLSLTQVDRRYIFFQ